MSHRDLHAAIVEAAHDLYEQYFRYARFRDMLNDSTHAGWQLYPPGFEGMVSALRDEAWRRYLDDLHDFTELHDSVIRSLETHD